MTRGTASHMEMFGPRRTVDCDETVYKEQEGLEV